MNTSDMNKSEPEPEKPKSSLERLAESLGVLPIQANFISQDAYFETVQDAVRRELARRESEDNRRNSYDEFGMYR